MGQYQWLLEKASNALELIAGSAALTGGWIWHRRRNASDPRPRWIAKRAAGWLISIPRRELVIADLREQIGDKDATIERLQETNAYQKAMLKKVVAELSADSSTWSSMERHKAERLRRKPRQPGAKSLPSTPTSSDDGSNDNGFAL